MKHATVNQDPTPATTGTIPWELHAIPVAEVARLLGLAPRTVLESLAHRADFPPRVSSRPASWVAGEVIAWRDAQRKTMRKSRRRVPA